MTPSTAHSESVQSSSSGTLTLDLVSSLRKGYTMSDADRACQNAVTNNEVRSLAISREVLRGEDGHFSHRIRSKGITHQQKSGRCWLFAALNVMRPQVIRDHGMADFEFSTAYLQFWDKLERANLFLESVIELRGVDFLDRDWEMMNKLGLEEGGWWNYAAGLVEKYGAVPQSVMPETKSSSDSAVFNEILGRLLRAKAAWMLERHSEGGELEELRELKSEILAEVYRFLVINLGEPPAEFGWRYGQTKKGDLENPDAEMLSVTDENLSPMRKYSPQSFYEEFVGTSLSEFVCLYHDPKRPLNCHYSFDRARNIAGNECMHFVNIDMDAMKKISVSSILANEPLWFAVNMGVDQSEEHGLMEHRLFDYEALFGIDLTLSKADRARFHSGVSGHAMVLMGVDLTDEGNPRKWLVENSWGDEKGNEGHWTILDQWFDEHVYTIIVHERHVPVGSLKVFEEEPIKLPAWYPGAGGSR